MKMFFGVLLLLGAVLFTIIGAVEVPDGTAPETELPDDEDIEDEAEIEKWKFVGDTWYRPTEMGIWVPVEKMDPILVLAERPNIEEPGTLFRIRVPVVTYYWHSEADSTWYKRTERPPADDSKDSDDDSEENDEDEEPEIAVSDTSWEELDEATLELTLDSALEDGHFLSTDNNKYQAHAETNREHVTWSSVGNNNSGTLTFTPDDSKSPSIAFDPPTADEGRALALSYTITCEVMGKTEYITFTQDPISTIQQQYIDLKRKRGRLGVVPTVPERSEFKTYVGTTNYSHNTYSDRSIYAIMYLGSVAEKIYTTLRANIE